MSGKYGVIVAGGGVAGCAAALSAARKGKRVLLIEKTLTLGGLGTIGLINLFVPMCNGRGRTIIKGMCEEFVALSQKYGWAHIPDEWKRGEPGADAKTRYVCRYSPYPFALALMEALTDAGVELLLDSSVAACDVSGGAIRSVTVFGKSGMEDFYADMFIDATGDSDLCKLAGCPTVDGENYFTYVAFEATLDDCRRALEANDIGALTHSVMGGEATLYGGRHPSGMKKFNGLSGRDVTEYVVMNQRELIKKLKTRSPNESDITTLPSMPQFRTTRRILGESTLKTSDVFVHRDDSICLICDFDHRDDLYEVPLGCIVNGNMRNLFAVGRCASAEGYAWDILRVIPPAILTGQAAGIAAAHAMDERRDAYDVDVRKLQAALMNAGVLIHYSEDMIYEGLKPGERAGAEGHI